MTLKVTLRGACQLKKKIMYLLCTPREFMTYDDCNGQKLEYPKYLWLFHVSCSVELYSVRLYGVHHAKSW